MTKGKVTKSQMILFLVTFPLFRYDLSIIRSLSSYFTKHSFQFQKSMPNQYSLQSLHASNRQCPRTNMAGHTQ